MQTNHLCWNQTNEAIWELRSNSLFNLLACWAEILLDIIVKIPSKVHFNWASSCMATIRSSGTITVLANYISQPQNPQSDHTSLLQKWQHLDSIWNICYPIKHPFAAGVHDCPLAQGPELASYTTNYCEGGVYLSMCRAVEADHCDITLIQVSAPFLAFVCASAFSSTLVSSFQAYSSSSCFPNSPQLYPSHSSWPFSIAFLRGEPGLSKHLNWTLVSGLPPHETTWLQGRQRACVPKHSLYWLKENPK